MIASDLRFALRVLRRSPAVAITAIVITALSVGMSTAFFSIFETILLRPLPYSQPDRLVLLSDARSTDVSRSAIDAWLAHEWQGRGRTIASVATFNDSQGTLVERGHAEIIRGMRVSAAFFDTIGVAAALGRTFEAGEDTPRPANVMILTYPFWTARFGGDPTVVGRTIEVTGQPVRIIGVLPQRFDPVRMSNPAEVPQYFAPIGYDPAAAERCRTCSLANGVVARLAPGATVGDASGELNAITRDIAAHDPADFGASLAIAVTPLASAVVESARRPVWLLFGAVLLVLLIASANLAALQLVRANARAAEFAVRAAIGAGRRRIARQLLVESLLVSGIGGIAGISIAAAALRSLLTLAPPELPRLHEIHLDARVYVFGMAVTALTGLICGLAPTWLAWRIDVYGTLRRTSNRGGGHGRRLRNGLIVADLALAFVLLTATGLLAQTFRHLNEEPWGFDATHVLTLTPSLGATGRYTEAPARIAYFREMLRRVRALPGVVNAGLVSNVPLSHAEPWTVRVRGGTPAIRGATLTVDTFIASPGYLATLRIPLVRGRDFIDADGAESGPVAIISASLASRVFPDADPLGRQIRFGAVDSPEDPWMTIVGIAGDARAHRLDAPAADAVYVPQAMYPYHYTRLAVRTIRDPMSMEGSLRDAIASIDPLQPVFHVQPMTDYVEASLSDRRFTLELVSLYAGIALLLAAIGIYGVVAYSVSQRSQEIGVRAALGATPARLMGLVFTDAARLAAGGLLIGWPLALVSERLLGGLLFGVTPADPWVLGSASIVLAVVTTAACALPARTATRVAPIEALRQT